MEIRRFQNPGAEGVESVISISKVYTPEILTWNLNFEVPGSLEIPFGNHHFQVPAVTFRGGTQGCGK